MEPDTIADVVQPGVTPAAPEAPTTSSTEPGAHQPEPSQPTVVENLDDLSSEQLDALLVQVEKGNVPVAPKTPEPAQTTEQPPPEPTPQDPDDPEAAPTKPDSEPLHRLRLNKVPAEHRDLVKLARDMLAEGKSREEVAAAIAGQSAAPPAPANPEAPTETTPAAKPTAKQEASAKQIADLKAQQEQALTVDFDTPKAISLATEIAKLEMRQEMEQTLQNQQQQTEAEKFVSAQMVHIEAVKKANPELMDEDSPLYQEFNDQRLLAEAKDDPVMDKADWALEIAKRARQRISPGTPAPAAKPATIPPPPPGIRPSGQLASGKPVPTISQTDVARALENLTLDQADELLARMK